MIIQEIKESGCEFRVIKLKGTGKNALDFYIAAECGIISERGENEIAIISNDKMHLHYFMHRRMQREERKYRIENYY